jgi:hypothetical protein
VHVVDDFREVLHELRGIGAAVLGLADIRREVRRGSPAPCTFFA